MKARQRDDFLKQYPELQRWINTCVGCSRIGYRPEMRDEFFHAGIGAAQIRRFFEELFVTEQGLCSDCANMAKDLAAPRVENYVPPENEP